MFIPKSKGLTLTLIFALTVALALITSSEAKPNDAPLPRDHGALKRLIRKRVNLAVVPAPVATVNAPAVSAPATPSTAANPPASSVAAPSPSDPASAPAASHASSSASAAAPSASAVPAVSSIASSIAATPVSSSVAVASAVTSALPPTTTAAAVTTSALPPVIATADPKVTSSAKKSSSPNIVTLTSEVSAASSTATGVPAKNAQIQKSVTTVLIVVASVVGGTAVIWTIIRKWKFSPSNSFEDRMQPIDWQPTNDESGIPVGRRLSNASSFHSAGHGENMAGYGVSGYGSTSDYGHNAYGSTDLAPGVAPLQPLPDHDFTAAPATHLAPVGGYADLSRGPSPGPYMQDPYRGPSPGPYMQDPYRGPSPGPQMQEAYRGPVGYQGHDASHDAYDYNGGTRY